MVIITNRIKWEPRPTRRCMQLLTVLPSDFQEGQALATERMLAMERGVNALQASIREELTAAVAAAEGKAEEAAGRLKEVGALSCVAVVML